MTTFNSGTSDDVGLPSLGNALAGNLTAIRGAIVAKQIYLWFKDAALNISGFPIAL